MWRTVILIGAMATAASVAQAAEVKKQFGNWALSVEKDPFGESDRVIALTIDHNSALAVRCLHGHLSILLAEGSFLRQGRFSEGMPLSVKFRADKKQIEESEATALDDTSFQIHDSEDMIKEMVGAKNLAFRISYKDTTYDRQFSAGPVATRRSARLSRPATRKALFRARLAPKHHLGEAFCLVPADDARQDVRQGDEIYRCNRLCYFGARNRPNCRVVLVAIYKGAREKRESQSTQLGCHDTGISCRNCNGV
jgi:hypothetical protein